MSARTERAPSLFLSVNRVTTISKCRAGQSQEYLKLFKAFLVHSSLSYLVGTLLLKLDNYGNHKRRARSYYSEWGWSQQLFHLPSEEWEWNCGESDSGMQGLCPSEIRHQFQPRTSENRAIGR